MEGLLLYGMHLLRHSLPRASCSPIASFAVFWTVRPAKTILWRCGAVALIGSAKTVPSLSVQSLGCLPWHTAAVLLLRSTSLKLHLLLSACAGSPLAPKVALYDLKGFMWAARTWKRSLKVTLMPLPTCIVAGCWFRRWWGLWWRFWGRRGRWRRILLILKTILLCGRLLACIKSWQFQLLSQSSCSRTLGPLVLFGKEIANWCTRRYEPAFW